MDPQSTNATTESNIGGSLLNPQTVIGTGKDKHALHPGQTQSADPPAPKHLKPMTQERLEEIGNEFREMEEERNDLDDDLIWECDKPTNMSAFEDREKLLKKAEELVEKERTFLRKWTLELKSREQLLK
jgi:hypothetical protein